MEEIDFEGAAVSNSEGSAADKPDTTNISGGTDDVTNINPTDVDSKTPPVEGEDKTNDKPADKKDDDNSSTGELEAGTIVEVEGTEYTVDDKGNLVDKNGTIFKQASEVKDFIASFNQEDGNDNSDGTIDISTVQNAIGIDVTDEDGKAIEFTNDAAGIKSYFDKVIELKTEEIQKAAINTIYEKNPIVKDFVNYLTINNGDYRGFGELTDRSGITLDVNNVAQQEAIIRASFKEFNKKGNVDNYIQYLKDSNGLADVAKEELKAMQEKDAQVKEELNRRAEEARKQELENTRQYWNEVHNAIANKVIAGYKLPDNLTIERDGQKKIVTTDDFFTYLSRVDKQTGKTAYQLDLDKMTNKEVLDKELLEAWLHFTGGSYKDLVDMAVRDENVKKLILKAKTHTTTTGKVNIKPANRKSNINDIIL